MSLDPEVQAAIAAHPSDDVRLVAREVSKQVGRFVPPTLVMQVRGASPQAAQALSQAREKAAVGVSDKLQVADDVAAQLLAIFQDELRPMKERLEAAKELRQYLKLGLDASGISDGGDTLFVIDQAWLAGVEK